MLFGTVTGHLNYDAQTIYLATSPNRWWRHRTACQAL